MTHANDSAGTRSSNVTRPDRVLDASTGITLAELTAYYAEAGALLLGQLRERPVTLIRFADGIDGPRRVKTHAGAPVPRSASPLAEGVEPPQPPLLEIRSPIGLQAAAVAGTVELHTWNATIRAIRKPDRIALTLDLGQGTGWSQVLQGASSVRAALADLGLKSFLKTSGATALHVVLPLMPSRSCQFVDQFAQALVTYLVDSFPGRFAEARSGPVPIGGKANGYGSTGAPTPSAVPDGHGVGKVVIDGRRNGWGATSLSAWSANASPGLGISVPVAWDELDRLTGGAHWTVRNAADRIAVGNRPWEQYAVSRQGLAGAVKALGFEMTAESLRPSTDRPGDRPMRMHDTPPVPENPPPAGPPPQPVTPEGDPIQPVTDPLSPGHAEPVREPPTTRPPASL